jgi:hypothetical protein
MAGKKDETRLGYLDAVLNEFTQKVNGRILFPLIPFHTKI